MMRALRYLPLALTPLLPAALAAQITITFAGDLNGSPIALDSILVQNLDAGGDTLLLYPDTVLVLGLSTGMRDFASHVDPIRSLPNPFRGSTDMEVASTGGEMLLMVHDATGRLVASQRVEATPGQHRFRYTSGMPGLHIVSVEQNGQHHAQRLVAVEGTGSANGTLSHLGAGGTPTKEGRPKSDRSLFTWQPGDGLRYIGYASNDTALFCGVLQETPFLSATRTFFFYAAACPEAPTVTDIDGNMYATLRIGDQCWMASNLKTSHYSDGSEIPNVTGNNEWRSQNTGAWCNYENNAVHGTTYGKLYNWFAAMDVRGVCPLGWHVPSDEEWKQLENTLGISADEVNDIGVRGETENVGGMMKATASWNAPNAGATNESGFSGLASGNRDGFSAGTFFNAGSIGYWWSSSDYGEFNYAWYRRLSSSNAGVGRYGYYKRSGFCIRCLQD